MSKSSKRRPGSGYAEGWSRIFGPEKALQELVDLSQELGLYDEPKKQRNCMNCGKPCFGELVVCQRCLEREAER